MARLKSTQSAKILRYLIDVGPITPLDALREFGCMRLAARILDLKEEGLDIRKEVISGKNRFGEAVHYARYTLVGLL